jgi:hypothetical protein
LAVSINDMLRHSGRGMKGEHHAQRKWASQRNSHYRRQQRWAECVDGLVHQPTMDVLHALSDEFVKLIADINGDLDKNIDVFDAKMKAAIATCERAAAEIAATSPP